MMNKPYNFAYVYNDAVQIEVLMHMIYNLHQYFFNLQKKKNIFYKNERRCRDIKTQMVNTPLPYNPT